MKANTQEMHTESVVDQDSSLIVIKDHTPNKASEMGEKGPYFQKD